MLDQNVRIRLQELTERNPFLPIYAAVVQILKDEISSCRLRPGERLKEIDTAEKLDVSRSTVRRAFEMLTLDGVVLRRNNGRVEIAPMLRKEYREIAEVRGMLDSYAARLAATRRTDEDIRTMRNAIAQLMDSNINTCTVGDLAFHKAIYDASHNSYIRRIYGAFNIELIRARYISAPGVVNMMNRIIEEHMEIYRAIVNQDVLAASRAAEKHVLILMEPSLLSVKGLENEEN